jgi:type II secretory pathway pseudopilin PulG
MAALLTLVLLAAVIAVVASPLLRRRSTAAQAAESVNRAELQSAREAKYREIRDAELDYRTGKLSREDYEAVDSSLRAEALSILDGLEALEGEKAAG